MRLTTYSDYAMRILIHLAARPGGLSTISNISKSYGISRNHLMKITQALAYSGEVETVRGKGGGIRLARPAEAISLGAVLRHTESSSPLVECFDRETNTCVITPVCGLKHVLFEALEAFYARLDRVTLADVVRNPAQLGAIFDRQAGLSA